MEDLQNETIDDLIYHKKMFQDNIDNFLEKVKTMKENIADINRVLEEKKKISTHNIVEVKKSKFWKRGSETEIYIYVKAVSDSDEKKVINQPEYKRLKYSDRTILFEVLNDLYSKYHFTKIVCDTMKMTKKICEAFDVVEKI